MTNANSIRRSLDVLKADRGQVMSDLFASLKSYNGPYDGNFVEALVAGMHYDAEECEFTHYDMLTAKFEAVECDPVVSDATRAAALVYRGRHHIYQSQGYHDDNQAPTGFAEATHAVAVLREATRLIEKGPLMETATLSLARALFLAGNYPEAHEICALAIPAPYMGNPFEMMVLDAQVLAAMGLLESAAKLVKRAKARFGENLNATDYALWRCLQKATKAVEIGSEHFASAD